MNAGWDFKNTSIIIEEDDGEIEGWVGFSFERREEKDDKQGQEQETQ